MKKLLWITLIVGSCSLLQAEPILSLVPPSQTVLVGQPVTIDVIISGLAAGGPPSVGTFDLDVSFNPSVLSPTAVTFGPFLGDPGLLEVLTAFTFPTGAVDFAAVSLLLPGQLDALQPAAFTLATLTFSALASGTSPLVFSQVIVDDAFGAKLSVSTNGAAVNAVPEPATLFLTGSGLVGVITFVWRHRRSLRSSSSDRRRSGA